MTHYDKKRFHVVLDGEDTRKLEKVAKAESLSVSWLIRRAIRQWLEAFSVSSSPSPKGAALPKQKDPLLTVIGSFHLNSVSNDEIDRTLYGH